MKTLNVFGFTALTWGLSLSPLANATQSKELALHCGGEYEVLSAAPYHVPPHGRAPGRSGTHEKIKVLSVEGPDCDKLQAYYGIHLEAGAALDYGVSQGETSLASAKLLAASRVGNTYPYQAKQTFGYETKAGSLPLFPKIHQESLQVLSLQGQANSQLLYGTPAMETLTESELLELLNEAYWAIDSGKKYQGHSVYSDDFLDFILNVQLEQEGSIQEYMEDLLRLFKNTSRYTSSFVTLHPGTLIGKKLNQLFNLHGKSKFSTQMTALKNHPLLFESQIIGWAFIEKGTPVPNLTEAQVVEFLEHALVQSQNLANVPQVLEARYLLGQYKEAAKTILRYSAKQPPAQYPHKEYFVVNAEAEALIASILVVK